MADQFCKIVDTTISDSTMGSDATQSIITTDASTSFVIRDVYKQDSCTSDNFCHKYNVIMDGQTVLENLSSEANGSLIVPPSTTVCIKDTTGNYPLSYEDINTSLYRFCCDACSCFAGWSYCDNGGCSGTQRSEIEEIEALYVNSIFSQNNSACCIPSCCSTSCANVPNNSCFCSYSTGRSAWNRCWIVYINDDCECTQKYGKVVRLSDGTQMFCHDNNCAHFLHEDGMFLYYCSYNCMRLWNLCQACSCFCYSAPHVHWCRASQLCSTYCCGSMTLSTPHKDCWACRVATSMCANGGCGIFFLVFNMCNCSNQTYCIAYNCYNAACTGYANTTTVGSIWDEDYNTWIGVLYGRTGIRRACQWNTIYTWRSCDCVMCTLCTATGTFYDNIFCYNNACFFNDKLYFSASNDATMSPSCNDLFELDVRGRALGTDTSCQPKMILCNFFCNTPACCGQTYCVAKTVPSSATVSGRTYTINPTSKLNIYGIKST